MQSRIEVRQLAGSAWDWALYTTVDGANVLGVMFSVGPYKVDIERFFAMPEHCRTDDPAEIAARIRREYPRTSYVEIPRANIQTCSANTGATAGESDLRTSASTTFADKVKTIIGPSLTRRGFTFDRVLEMDEGGRIGFAAFFRNTICKVQVYWSARERELNCMIAAHSAPYVHGLYDKSAQWHYLNESVSEIPLEELVEQTRSDKALFKNRDTWLTWLAARIDEYYESAVAGIQGETDLNGDAHEHH